MHIGWYNTTFVFYLIIILCSYFIPLLFNKKILKITNKIKIPVNILLIAVILLTVKCLGTTGRDLRSGYYYNFLSAKSFNSIMDNSMEFGFKLFMIVLRNITARYELFLIIVGLISIIPVIYMLIKYKNVLSIPIYLLYYVSIYYFATFSPLRATMAASIGFLAFGAILEKKYKKALTFIFWASLIHITAILLVIPLVMVSMRSLNKKMIFVCYSIMFIAIIFGRNSLADIFLINERYNNYKINNTINLGFEQILYYLPIFILYGIARKQDEDTYISKVSFSYLITGFFFGMVGYIIPILGRLQSLFLPITFIVAYYSRIIKLNNKNRLIIDLIILVYCLFRFWIFISQYYILEDLMPYTNVFKMIV